MRTAAVYRNGIFAGILTEENRHGYTFTYDESYYIDNSRPAISLTLSKKKRVYRSEYLFPFFFNMLPEGSNKSLQCRKLKIDENDSFGLLLASAQSDTIGAITVRPIKENI